MSGAERIRTLEESTGSRPSVGQLVSVIVRSVCRAEKRESRQAGEFVSFAKSKRCAEHNAVLEQRIAAIVESVAARRA